MVFPFRITPPKLRKCIRRKELDLYGEDGASSSIPEWARAYSGNSNWVANGFLDGLSTEKGKLKCVLG